MKNAPGSLIEAKQYANEGPISGDGIELPVEQVLHLTWDASSFSPRVNSLVLPAYQSIELLRDYRRAEQAIAKRWATPFRLEGVGVDAPGGAVVGGLRGTRGAGEGEGVFDEEAVSGDDRERVRDADGERRVSGGVDEREGGRSGGRRDDGRGGGEGCSDGLLIPCGFQAHDLAAGAVAGAVLIEGEVILRVGFPTGALGVGEVLPLLAGDGEERLDEQLLGGGRRGARAGAVGDDDA